MKRLSLVLACFIGVMFFASCNQEVIDDLLQQKPEVAFVQEEGFLSSPTSLYVGDTLNFKVKVAPNSGSASEITSINFAITDLAGNTVYTHDPEITDPAGETVFTETFTPTAASTYTVTATVKDAANKMNIATVVIDYVQPTVAGIGVFEGYLTINGHLVSDQPIMGQQIDQDVAIDSLFTTITLGALEENNRISATFEIDGTPVTLYCTQDGENLVFDEFHLNKTVNVVVDINLDIVINATGILTDDTLTLTGDADGTGAVAISLISVTTTMDGDVSGTLNKVPEE